MTDDESIAFFITWTVYGTFLQGDLRGWRRRKNGNQTPQPALVRWRRERLRYPIEPLNDAQRLVVDDEIHRLAGFRDWHVWTSCARTNHVHVIVTANGYSGGKVRDQFKANCTRVLRKRWPQFVDRPIWTVGGDWQCINDEDGLEQASIYVREAQDRMQFDDRKQVRSMDDLVVTPTAIQADQPPSVSSRFL